MAKDKLYYCTGGRYTKHCIVKARQEMPDGIQVEIVKVLPKERECQAEEGQVWVCRYSWLKDLAMSDRGRLNPNILFQLRKKQR